MGCIAIYSEQKCSKEFFKSHEKISSALKLRGISSQTITLHNMNMYDAYWLSVF